jgi:hypothetical protein
MFPTARRKSPIAADLTPLGNQVIRDVPSCDASILQGTEPIIARLPHEAPRMRPAAVPKKYAKRRKVPYGTVFERYQNDE